MFQLRYSTVCSLYIFSPVPADGFDLDETSAVTGTYSATITKAGKYVISCTATDEEGNTGTGEVEVDVYYGKSGMLNTAECITIRRI